MGTLCSGGVEGSTGAVVDDAEILFVGKRAAENQVNISKGGADLPQEILGEPTGGADGRGVVRGIVTNPDRDRRRAKAAIALLVRSLVRGRPVVISSVGVGTQDCTAWLDRELTQLTLCPRDDSASVLLRIPLETVIQVAPEGPPGTARYPFGECSVRMLLERHGDVIIQLDSREECDAFVSSVRACAKHLRGAVGEKGPAAAKAAANPSGRAFDEESVPSTIVRAVGFMRDPLGLASALTAANTPKDSLAARHQRKPV